MRTSKLIALFTLGSIGLTSCGSETSHSSDEAIAPAVGQAESGSPASEDQVEPHEVDVDPCALLGEEEIREVVGSVDVSEESRPDTTTTQGSLIASCEWNVTSGPETTTLELSTYKRYSGTQEANRLLRYRASSEDSEEIDVGSGGRLLSDGSIVFTAGEAFFELRTTGDLLDLESFPDTQEEIASLVVQNYDS